MNPSTLRMLKTLSRPVPRKALYRAAHHVVRRDYHKFLKKRLGPYFVEVEEGPSAPKEILTTTRAMDERERDDGMLDHQFFTAAYKTVHGWLSTCEEHGKSIRTIGSVLEIGCGSARLLRHFRCMEGTRLVGCDVDKHSVDWCRENIPGITFFQNRLEPPLEFADDDSFDLIIAASVFTHVPVPVQRAWLLELRRVMRPGGLFLCTVEGYFNHRRQLTEEDRATLRHEGQVTLDKQSPNASLSTKALGSWDVFQTRDRVVEAYGSVLELLDYIPSTQDLLVLRKPLSATDLPRRPGPKFYPELYPSRTFADVPSQQADLVT